MNWSALHLRSTNTLLFRKCNYAMLTNTCLALSHLSVCGRRETRPAESRHLRIARWGPCPRRTTADTESAHVVVSGSTGRPSAGQTCEFSVSHASIQLWWKRCLQGRVRTWLGSGLGSGLGLGLGLGSGLGLGLGLGLGSAMA